MKKFLALLAGALVLFAPAFFISCSNDDDDGDDGTVGQIVGYVLDNKGEPVEGATIALGTQLTQSNVNGVFTLNKVAANKAPVNPSDTYTLLVTKDGYLPTTIPNVIVLSKFNYNYKEKLDALMKIYIGMNQGETGLSTQEALAAAFEALPASYTTDTSTLSTFASAELIPLDASFEGTVKLNTMPKGATTLGEEKLREGVKVRARYAGTSTTADYSDETTTDARGAFKFENLPSGVPITLEIDAFVDNYNGCYYSSESADYIGNQTGTSNGETITLVSGGSNVQSYTIMLYAQVDKIWVVGTNVNTSTPLSPTASIRFTFNTPMKNLSLLSSDIADISEGKYTVEIDTPNVVVTVTPNDGRWSPLGNKASLILNGEATNGAKAIINNEFDVYFDTGVWVSIEPSTADEGLPLNTSIRLTFSKAMKQDTVSITAGDNTFTKNWNDDYTSVRLTPKGNNWNCNSDGSILFTVTGEAIDGANDISYWKTNADSNGVKAYFDTSVLVSIAPSTADERLPLNTSITLTFSKAMNQETVSITAGDNTFTKNWNDDSTSVRLTPKGNNWNCNSSDGSILFTVTGEAIDGANDISYWKANADSNGVKAYFDTGVWVSIDPSTADEGLPLNMPIALTFSKAMNQKTVSITAGDNNTFTKNWSSDYTSVTLTPKGNSWNCNSDGSILFTVTGEAIDGANGISYWKANADSNGVKAYFNTYIDVTVTTDTTGTDTITLTFSKALKAFTTDNINIQATDSTVTAYTVAFDGDREVRITASTKDGKFAKAGKYRITLTGIEAKDGSTQLRKAGETRPTTVFYTDLAFAGTALKATDVDVVTTNFGRLSRALVTTSQYLKITFNRTILQSRIVLGSSNTDNSADNYIDGTDVYIPLSSVPGVDAVLGVSGLESVVDEDGNTLSWEAQDALNILLAEKNFYVRPKLTLEDVSYVWEKGGTIQNGGATTVIVDSVILDNRPVSFTFSGSIEAGAEVRYQIMYNDPASSPIYPYGSMTVSGDTNNVELPTEGMRYLKSHLSDNDELINNYYIALEITKDGNTLFSTASKFFGNASTMEKKLSDASVITDSTIRVPVKTTTVESVVKRPSTSTGVSSTITVRFNHDVPGYKPRLCNYDGNSYPPYEQGSYIEESVDYVDYTVDGDTMTITVRPKRYSTHASGKVLVGIIDRYGDWVDFAGEESLVCDWNELVTLEVEDVVTSADAHTITVTFNYDVTGYEPKLYNYDGYSNSYPSYEQGNYFEEFVDYTVDGNRMTITVYPNRHSTHASGKILVGIINRYGEWVYFSDEARLVRDWNELVTLEVENVETSVYAHTITVTFNYDVTDYTAQLYNNNYYYPTYKPIGDEISEYVYSNVNRNVMTITISLTEAKSGNVLVGICDTYNNWVSNLVNADSLVRNWSDLWLTE